MQRKSLIELFCFLTTITASASAQAETSSVTLRTDGKTMKGKVNLAGFGEGTFSGKKQ